jgi:hypothetical protein
VDLPGIDSKFIETHCGVLASLLDLVLPSNAIDPDQSGLCNFASRYGFLDKPHQVRFRVLDARLALLPGVALPDITLDADSFATLNAPIRRVFVTENEINFLAFPPAAHSIVIFGAGYGFDAIGLARWLSHTTIHYWGDIDTHGFAMLDQLRCHFEHVQSFLMDRPTLMAHEAMWGIEKDQCTRDLARLNEAEKMLFDDLRDNRIRRGVRLEQERIRFQCIQTALDRLFDEH